MSKRTVIGLLAIFFGAIIFAGCVGTTALGVLDESVPEQSLVNLELRDDLRVVLYDSQPVDWGPSGLTHSRATIGIPPGYHKLMIAWTESSNSGGFINTYTHTKDIEQDFAAGSSYRIYMQKIWLLFFTIKNVKIKDVTK